jgi:hypothetical protein
MYHLTQYFFLNLLDWCGSRASGLIALCAVFGQVRDPASNPTVQAVYAEWVRDTPGSAAARALLHTQYGH